MESLYSGSSAMALRTGATVQVRTTPLPGRACKCLLLHGNPGSLEDWSAVVPRLAKSVDIAAFDMPGFGRSARTEASAEGLDLDRLAEHTLAVADALTWQDPFVLVGHSHGGGVAQAVAARYPHRVAGLVLVSTLGVPAHRSYRLLSLPGSSALAQLAGRLFRHASVRGLSRRILRAMMQDAFSPEPVPDERLDRELALYAERPEVLRSMVQVTLGRPCSRLSIFARQIQCPVLFLHGTQDAVVPIEHARTVHDLLLNAGQPSEFQRFEGSGHMLLQFQAEQVAEWVARFVAEANHGARVAGES